MMMSSVIDKKRLKYKPVMSYLIRKSKVLHDQPEYAFPDHIIYKTLAFLQIQVYTFSRDAIERWIKPASFEYSNDDLTVKSILQPSGSNQYLLLEPAVLFEEQPYFKIRIDEIAGYVWIGVIIVGKQGFGFYNDGLCTEMTLSYGSYSVSGRGIMGKEAKVGDIMKLNIDENSLVTFSVNDDEENTITINVFVGMKGDFRFIIASPGVGNKVTLTE